MIKRIHNFFVFLISQLIFEPSIKKKFRYFFSAKIKENFAYSSGSTKGKYSYLGENCYIYHPETRIGKFSSIAHNVIIGAGQHPAHWLSSHPFTWVGNTFNVENVSHRLPWEAYSPVFIGNDVWIGINVVIMDGITIGDGSIIASNAVVNKDIPPYEIWGGIPAKFLKKRFNDSTIDHLLKLRWWDMDESMLSDIPYDNVEQCIHILEKRKTNE